MGQMAVRCCRSPSRSSIVNTGCREFVLLFQRSLIPSFPLIINAPNASRNDLAGAPRSAKFWAYSASNYDRRMSLAPIAQRLSSASFPAQGNWKSKGGLGSGSIFRWWSVMQESWPIRSRFFLHFSTFFGSDNPTPRLLFQFIKQALCKVAQSTLQQPEHTTKQSILNQRHGSSLAHKWCLWLCAASNTIHRGARGNLIRVR